MNSRKIKTYKSNKSSKRLDSETSLSKSKESKKESEEKLIIKKLLSQNIHKRSANLGKMLEVTCKNPDNCLALGDYDEVIKRYFENFQNLELVDNSALKRIGKPSNNGFIIEVPFKKHNYTAYTALKCSSVEDSDNLLYEYYVGKYFINKYSKMYPCFVETYDLYEYKTEQDYKIVKERVTSNKLSNIDFKTFIQKVDITGMEEDSVVDYSCLKNKLLCVLIQHFDKFISFDDEFNKNHDNIKYDLYNLMYQVYFPLCMLGSNYTHYDLHANNVSLYKPLDGKKCILMRYHHKGQVFEFRSEYIVKIIDYGRNYFNNGKITSKEIIEKVCKQQNCQPYCGEKQGYNIIQGDSISSTDEFYWINPRVPNVSHDLRFIEYIHDESLINTGVIKKLTYKEDYGTPENTTGNASNVTSIYNLLDALELKLNIFNSQKSDKKYANWKVAAEMDIYDDGREYTFNVLPDMQ